MTTEKKTNVYQALLKAQLTATNLKKDKAGYGYKYGDLTQLLALYKEHFMSNGLAVIQGHKEAPEGQICVVTQLIHAESGETIETDYYCPLDKQGGPQGSGSATTYGRRYALEGLMGISHEDDDGVAAQKPKQQTKQPAPQKKPKLVEDTTEVRAGIKALCGQLGIDITRYLQDNQIDANSSKGILQRHYDDLQGTMSRASQGTLSEAEQHMLKEYAA